MVALETPAVQTGWRAKPFELLATDGRKLTLDQLKGAKGTLVMFICNHCPYVKAIMDRLLADTAELKLHGVNTIAIMSNDTADYPEDSFENMTKLAKEKGFTFPYLLDDTQDVAKAYDAVCTPDFFGFNANLELQYRGRLDESWSLAIPNPKRELLTAMKEIAATGTTTIEQWSSVGCSIKWKSTKKAAQG